MTTARHNPIAAALRQPALRPRQVKPRKGKGAYVRKGRKAKPTDRLQPGREN